MIKESNTKHSMFAILGTVDQSVSQEIALPRVDQQSYYRPSVFHSSTSVNPLIAAAASLFIINSHIQQGAKWNNSNELYQLIMHELLAFETLARQEQYISDTINMARFFIIVMLEETLQKAENPKQVWQRDQLLHSFQKIEDSDERFFILLDKLAQDPALHIELLEFAYLVLCQGYQGIYKNETEGLLKVSQKIQTFYEIIRTQRQHINSLFSQNSKANTINSNMLATYFSAKKYWIFNGSILGLSILSYLGFIHYALKPLTQTLATFQNLWV